MKIALVSPYDFAVPGGVNSHVQHLADHLTQMGHQVRIIAPSSRKMLDRDDIIIIGEHPIGVPAGGSVARITLSLTLAGTVKEVLARECFDIVHLHEPFMPFLPFQFLRFSSAVNIATFHATKDRGNRLYAYGRHIVQRWMTRLDGRICVSPAALRMISRYFPGYYTIIPNGIDLPHFTSDVRPLPEFTDGKLNILFVGRLEKRKGLKYLLRAYRQVKQEMSNTRLIIVGPDDGNRGRYQRYVQRNGLSDVVFAGYVPYGELPRYYKSAHVFCAPNTGNESQGIVLLEAMAVGVPVVASNIEGFAYVITHGVHGLLVLPKDSDALAMALVHILADADLRQEMSQRGRLRAQEYSWERIAQQLASFYERTLHDKTSRAPS